MREPWFERGHVAIVTGGSRGLGRSLARELLDAGLRVVVDGRDPAALERARIDLAAHGDVVAISGDVADLDHVHALIAAARRLGRLDLLINNASTLGETPLPRVDELREPVFIDLFRTNVFAPIHLIGHALPLMRRLETATIVNVTSDAAVHAYPGWAGYGASKAALEHVSRVLAEELQGSGIRVLVADPGDMNTEMHRAAIPGADPAELADPQDVARALVHAIANAQSPYERVELGAAAAV